MLTFVPAFMFLGHCQTFLGVLVTVLAICLFADKGNNLIFSITEDIRERVRTRIGLIKIKTDFDKLIKSPDYYIVSKYAHDKGVDNNLQQYCFQFMAKVQNQKGNLTISSLPSAEELCNHADIISKYSEQRLATFHTLLYCILVFFVDGMLSTGWCDEWMTLLSLALVSICMMTFWIVVWCFYIWNCRLPAVHKETCDNWQSTQVNKTIGSTGSCMKNISEWMAQIDPVYAFLIRILICLIPLAAGLLCVQFLEIKLLYRYILLVALTVLPMVAVGWHRMACMENKGHYEYTTVLNHTLWFVVMGVVIALIIEKLIPETINVTVDDLSFGNKVVIFAVVLLNGIVLPYWLPEKMYSKVYNCAKAKAKNTEKLLGEQVRILDEEAKRLSKKIIESQDAISSE